VVAMQELQALGMRKLHRKTRYSAFRELPVLWQGAILSTLCQRLIENPWRHTLNADRPTL